MFKFIVTILFALAWPFGFMAAGLHLGFMAGYRSLAAGVMKRGA